MCLLLTACSTGNTAGGGPSSTAAPPTSSSSAGSGDGTCPTGTYEVTTISGKAGTQVNGAPLVARSGGGLKLALTTGGAWTLTGSGTNVRLEAGSVAVEGTVNGTADGTFSKPGDKYVFQLENASGEITLKQPIAGISTLPMSQVAPALAPTGTVTLTCGPDTLRIESDAVVLELRKLAASAPPSTPPSATTMSPAPGSGGATQTLNESGRQRTIDCAGGNVVLNGSGNQLTFTGSCGAFTVNGSENQIKLDKIGRITINGTGNQVLWTSGEPQVADNGNGNSVVQS
ncbi:MAG TPA: DUF3060 domain-containing protein [Actinophytocola sp.]|uniref:DUF3060 domain-containing protein n=1 Tax=Actinophytocola sp. TaxID=1872138 RepID=UPI002DBB7C44|nr:DUF3060 domain-containing protein [Actinophytocola sp.]HEU5475761.1 DUF3060 domain-containing protein [Actinophytocola sp.]